MKKWLSITIVLILVLVCGYLTGCLDEQEVHKAEGTAYNSTDDTIKLKATCNSGMYQTVEKKIYNNSTVSFALYMDNWVLEARYYDTDEKIDTETLKITKEESTFTIIIYDDSIYAHAS